MCQCLKVLERWLREGSEEAYKQGVEDWNFDEFMVWLIVPNENFEVMNGSMTMWLE
jgi:hypothetical protein